jgi:hypothetical protein
MRRSFMRRMLAVGLLGGNVPIQPLLRDLFTTDRAAGAVNGTPMEGIGAGNRVGIDAEGKMTLSGGRLLFAGGKAVPAYGDPGLWGPVSFARKPGIAMVVGGLNFTTRNLCKIGWDNGQSGSPGYPSVWFQGSNKMGFNFGGSNMGLPDDYAAATPYRLMVVLRDNGGFCILDGGAFSGTLLWPDSTQTATPLYPCIANYSAVMGIDKLEVWELGGGYASNYGYATNRLGSPVTGDTTTSLANAINEFTWTPLAGETLEWMTRRTDDNNGWIVRCAQAAGTIKLFEKVAGVETERDAGKVQTWAVGTPYRILITQDGNSLYTFVGTTAKHTYTSAAFNATATGVKVSGFASGQDLICWPRHNWPLPPA